VRGEDLASEKSHFSLSLTPRSPRMQYGIDLMRALLAEIRRAAAAHGSRLLLFTHVPPLDFENVYVIPPGVEKVRVLDGRYYRVSRAQHDQNIEDINRGFDFRAVPITVHGWRVSPMNAHLSEIADDQVMRDLAAEVARVIRAYRPPRG
jgi:hypothetical protein